MIHVKDSLLLKGKVWSLDFLGSIFGQITSVMLPAVLCPDRLVAHLGKGPPRSDSHDWSRSSGAKNFNNVFQRFLLNIQDGPLWSLQMGWNGAPCRVKPPNYSWFLRPFIGVILPHITTGIGVHLVPLEHIPETRITSSSYLVRTEGSDLELGFLKILKIFKGLFQAFLTHLGGEMGMGYALNKVGPYRTPLK